MVTPNGGVTIPPVRSLQANASLLRKVQRQRAFPQELQGCLTEEFAEQQVLGRVPRHDQVGTPVLGVWHQFMRRITRDKVGFDTATMGFEVALHCFQPPLAGGGIAAKVNHPNSCVWVEPRLHEVLEGLGTLQ